MADFLITARITAPDGLLEQAQKLAGLAEPLKHFEGELSGVMGVPVAVKLERVRAAKGSVAAADPAKPKRERKKRTANGDGAGSNIQTPAHSADLLGDGRSGDPYAQAGLGQVT